MSMSLEEERRALLEEIEARRSLYRHMLSGPNEERQIKGPQRQISGHALIPQHNRVVRWLLDHPWQVTTGVALLVWLGPRLIKRNQSRPNRLAPAQAAAQRRGLPKAIASMMMIFLKDPRQLQSTASMLRNVWRWLRQATSNQTSAQGRKPYA
ncbi:MAG: hypothetical protein RI928_139 [Pseudomonadota bacterium]|jgi:hypothetical protein